VVDGAIKAGKVDVVLDLARRAYESGPDRFEGEEGFSGRDLAAEIVCRTVDQLEITDDDRFRKTLRDMSDGVFRILFGLESPEPAGP
jgi:hypothetical protein